ncbi:hypothetical protein SAMN05421736_10667 [Evansella caseinilytica]|uniref:Uncharacterized protein n=1 Tax=Evansella caseinilytica TaxID=1503961 RepID=A0A1H3QAT4_9BACI|nr:hypothetical protein [Evansella caseinilytica]SDZ09809.1 hypothetical protein SAMN05421736_10667 [Evansella caseinilytica]
MQISQCFAGATAVTKAHNGDFFAAVDSGISLIHRSGTEKMLIQLDRRILDLTCMKNTIYGVGDNGIFIRSSDYGETWQTTTLPTKGSIWSVCASEHGTIATHGNNVIFVSNDFGNSWKTIRPFHSLKGAKPSIRSLLLDEHYVYAGTKVHPQYGGIWRIDLHRYEVTRIKKDTRMIASLLKYKQYLVSAAGTCKEAGGSIEYCHAFCPGNKQYRWRVCESDCQERCYLDLSQSDDYLYTTTSQDRNGVGRVSRVYLEDNKVVPCALVHGHGWRISNHQSQYFVAGLYTSLYSNSEMQQLIQH